jgi:hypothetical protein
MICYLCRFDKETRPYGPWGEDVCFSCAMLPANKATTERMFSAQLEAAGPIAVIGEEVGPYPLSNEAKQ